jgi:hypothetical protein
VKKEVHVSTPVYTKVSTKNTFGCNNSLSLFYALMIDIVKTNPQAATGVTLKV